ncbi:hypothetical protein SAMN05414139_05264 [Burkholderia sp. D7]|nr:hypothetical protein SAMN05414139_05264 [Burkholderia sp. D7]
MPTQQASGACNAHIVSAPNNWDHELAMVATKTWARATMHFTGLSASAVSKRFSPPASVPGSNSKRFYGLARGEHVVLPGTHGRYSYDLLSAVSQHPLGRHATRYYFQPWELFRRDVTLDRTYEILHELTPWFATEFFYEEFPGLKNQRGWLRKRIDVPDEMQILVDHLRLSPIAEHDNSFTYWERTFDVFVALWCLYREAEMRRDIGRTIFFRQAIGEAQKQVAVHPVFGQVFKEYRNLVQHLEADEISILPRARAAQRRADVHAVSKPRCICIFDTGDRTTKIEYSD